MSLKTGFWSDKQYHLNKMTLRELVAAYFQYYAIQAYILLGIGSAWAAAHYYTGNLWRDAAGVAVAILLYPLVWYMLHRWVLHGQLLYKFPLTARTWKRIHFDHHMDPHNLSILFGALHTTLPPIFLVTFPVGYAFDGLAGGFACLAAGLFMTCFNEFSHCIQHLGYKPKYEFLKRWKQLHMAHHFHDENGNFGITDFTWDRLFGTYYERADRPEKSETVFNLGYTREMAKKYPWVKNLTPNMEPDATPRDRRSTAA